MIYDYEKRPVVFKREVLDKNKRFIRARITYRSFLESRHPEANTVVAYTFEPEDRGVSTAVIFLHGMGERNLVPLSWFPEKLAENGILSYLLVLPYHFERTPLGMRSGRKFVTDDMDETIFDFRHAVIDVRTSIDLLESSYGVHDFAIMGFSFGGMVAVIAMGVERRVSKGIFVVTGGNFYYTTWFSPAMKEMRLKYRDRPYYSVYGCSKEKCGKIHINYERMLEGIESPEQVESASFPKDCFLFDPLTFAPLLKGRKLLFFQALFDEVIPKKASDMLWKWMGKPERHFLFSGHFLSILYRRKILKETLKLLLSR